MLAELTYNGENDNKNNENIEEGDNNQNNENVEGAGIIILHFNTQFTNTTTNFVPTGDNVFDKLEKMKDKGIFKVEGNKLVANKDCNITIYGSAHALGGSITSYVYVNTVSRSEGNSYGHLDTFLLKQGDYIQLGIKNTEKYWNGGSFTIIAW